MHVEATSLAAGCTLRADVCIVGAGPAGLTIARELAEAGLEVVLLEAGPFAPPPGASYEPIRNVGLPYALAQSRARGVGGTSLRWWLPTPMGDRSVRLRELDPIDFEERPGLDRSGWPFGKSTLEPFYRSAWRLFGLRPPGEGDEAVVAAPVERRTFAFAPASLFAELLPRYLRDHGRVRLVTRAAVVDVRTDAESGSVSSLQCRVDDGDVAFSAVARAYVLAGGGIENPRLLLVSRSRHPTGLGNAKDLVGRCFMEHPHFDCALFVPARGSLVAERAAWAVVSEAGECRQRKYGLNGDALRREGLLNAAFLLTPRPVARPAVLRRDGELDRAGTKAVRDVRAASLERRPPSARVLAELAAATPDLARYVLRQALADRTRWLPGTRQHRVFTVSVMAEQEPLPASRVRLGRELDRSGTPVAELDWRLGALDLASARVSLELIAPALGAALGGRVVSLLEGLPAPRFGGGHHHMGATRMSSDPASGVVDAQCRVHEVRNLYVAGSSVFPTGGFANPTLTVVALALRLAEHLARELRSGAL